jgi:hypothetical protein
VVRCVMYEGISESSSGEQKRNWQAESKGCANLKVRIVLNIPCSIYML